MLFASFLIGLFILFLVIASAQNTENFVQKIKKLAFLSHISGIQTTPSLAEMPKVIHQISSGLTPLLTEMKTKLPNSNFSYQQSQINALEVFLKEANTVADSLPFLQASLADIQDKASFTSLLAYIHGYEEHFFNLQKSLQGIQGNLQVLSLFSQKTASIVQNIAILKPWIDSLESNVEAVRYLLGDMEPHTTLILLQNSAEKRATGGFIGSFVSITMNDGKVQDFKFHDIYEYDGQLTNDKRTPPKLAETLVNGKSWSLRDANFSPDFALSAQTFMDFYEKAGGNTADTAIAIDQSLIENIIDDAGGIDLPEYGVHLSKENFGMVLSYIVEGKMTPKGPKTFLDERLIPLFLAKLKEIATPQFLLKTFQQEKGNIHMYSRNETVEKFAQVLGLANNPLSEKNTVIVSQVSVSGNKSDAYVHQDFSLKNSNCKDVRRGGQCVSTLTIDRFHNWSSVQDQQYNFLKNHISTPNIPESELLRILGQGSNHALFQVFFPKGTSLIQPNDTVAKTKTWDEGDFTIAEFDLKPIFPGESQKVEVKFEALGEYALKVL